MSVSTYSPGWFHPGAERTGFQTVGIRATQDLNYAAESICRVGPESRRGLCSVRNSGLIQDQGFYTDRSLPKRN